METLPILCADAHFLRLLCFLAASMLLRAAIPTGSYVTAPVLRGPVSRRLQCHRLALSFRA